MKNRKPLRSTVANYISATGQNKSKSKRRTSMKDFFEDLENRGPFKPDSLFEKFTKKVRQDMEKAGTWISETDENLDFVAEYVARLLQEYTFFLGSNQTDYWKIESGRFVGYQKHFIDFRKIYIKIRVWGLRTKLFRLRRWGLVKYPLQFATFPNLWPFDYSQKYNSSQPTFRYTFFSHDYEGKNRVFFEREYVLKKTSST